jgi:RHS repeat-associated protein
VWTLSEGATLEQATAWRGRRQDITGFYWMGARYYESSSGRFLSPDPYGHAASLSLYDYAGGDPINFVDPTGRLQQEQNAGGSHVGRYYVSGDQAISLAPDPDNPKQSLIRVVDGQPMVFASKYANGGAKGFVTRMIGPWGELVSEGWEPASKYPGAILATQMTQLAKPVTESDGRLLNALIDASVENGPVLTGILEVSVNLALMVNPASGVLQAGTKTPNIMVGQQLVRSVDVPKIPVFNPQNGTENCAACVAAFFNTVKTKVHQTANAIERDMGSILGFGKTQLKTDGAALSYVEKATGREFAKRAVGFSAGHTPNLAEGYYAIVVPQKHIMVGAVLSGGRRVVFDPQNHTFMSVEQAIELYKRLDAYRVIK